MIVRPRHDSGFSALELLIVLTIVGSMAAIGLPLSAGMIDDIKIRGDAQGLSAAVAQAKLTAAAKFTHSRLFVNLAANTYRIQSWQRTGTPGWVNSSDDLYLSDRGRFGFGAATVPPPNTQPNLAQAPACLDNLNNAIASTACVIFNSRGVSVLAAGPPATTQAIYLAGPSGTYGIILGATGQLQVWHTTQAGVSSWKQR
ncbi:MAG TPA: prepilin-type N-terminal cleavage/methylation domain-containing protein [Vicinamibacterales bacterium]|nr:prepilin-type N-terminal cleavage/methylation domain-containing protein [Vicinamibacterales bacterium]